MKWPKGCMVESYAMEESMGFLTEYMQGFMLVNRRMWDVKEEGVSGKVFEGAGKSVDLGQAFRDIAHHCVFNNTTTMVTWVKY
jgi:hypothetical protein